MSRPLLHKLGFGPGDLVWVVNAPEHYSDLLGAPLDDIQLDPDPPHDEPLDAVHAFLTERAELAAALPLWMGLIRPGGCIWISWPKKASGVPSEIDGNGIRDIARPLGLIDVKVCSVSDVWSAAKFVVRRK